MRIEDRDKMSAEVLRPIIMQCEFFRSSITRLIAVTSQLKHDTCCPNNTSDIPCTNTWTIIEKDYRARLFSHFSACLCRHIPAIAKKYLSLFFD